MIDISQRAGVPYQEVLELTGWKDIAPAEQVFGRLRLLEAQQPQAAQQPLYAVNPDTGERIVSTDGGQTWQPAPNQ